MLVLANILKYISDILLLLKYFLYCKCHKRQFYTAELRLLCAWSKFSVGTMQHKSQNKLSLLTPTSACSLKVYALYWCINIMHHIVLHLCCLLPALNYGKPFLPWKKNYKKGIFNFLSELISCNSEFISHNSEAKIRIARFKLRMKIMLIATFLCNSKFRSCNFDKVRIVREKKSEVKTCNYLYYF